MAKDGTISLDRVTYQLPAKPCLVAFKVQLHIHPGERLRVLPHGDPAQRRRKPLTVEELLDKGKGSSPYPEQATVE